LSREDLTDAQANLDELLGDAWQDGADLSGADKQALDLTLSAYEKSPDAGSAWDDVKARVQVNLRA
jgi:hypothetical protein